MGASPGTRSSTALGVGEAPACHFRPCQTRWDGGPRIPTGSVGVVGSPVAPPPLGGVSPRVSSGDQEAKLFWQLVT